MDYTSVSWQLPSHEDVIAREMEQLLLRPPITTHLVIKVSKAKMPGSCWGRYVHIAVMECPLGVQPRQIRNTKTQRIIRYWGRLHDGKTERSASGRAYNEAVSFIERGG